MNSGCLPERLMHSWLRGRALPPRDALHASAQRPGFCRIRCIPESLTSRLSGRQHRAIRRNIFGSNRGPLEICAVRRLWALPATVSVGPRAPVVMQMSPNLILRSRGYRQTLIPFKLNFCQFLSNNQFIQRYKMQ